MMLYDYWIHRECNQNTNVSSLFCTQSVMPQVIYWPESKFALVFNCGILEMRATLALYLG